MRLPTISRAFVYPISGSAAFKAGSASSFRVNRMKSEIRVSENPNSTRAYCGIEE